MNRFLIARSAIVVEMKTFFPKDDWKVLNDSAVLLKTEKSIHDLKSTLEKCKVKLEPIYVFAVADEWVKVEFDHSDNIDEFLR